MRVSQKRKLNFLKKCYQQTKLIVGKKINKWLERITKFSSEINYSLADIQIKGTAKLDGFAGYDDGNKLYTRGDGNKGSDISRVFERGLGVFNNSERGQGPGEIVVKRSYFEKYLSNHFEYPRNFQASLIKEKELDNLLSMQLELKLLYLFHLINYLIGLESLNEFRKQFLRYC